MARAGSVVDLIRARTEQHPDSVWLEFEADRYLWRDVLSLTRRASNGLLELGVHPGDRVALMMGNRPEFLWVHFALGLIGAATVPVNISQRGVTLRHILADSGSVAVIFEDDLRDAVSAVRQDVASIRAGVVADGAAGGPADWTLERLLGGADREPAIDDMDDGTAPTPILYTSGTTGPPKGVVSRPSDPSGILAVLSALDVHPGEAMYTALPLFHGNALFVSVFGSMHHDARLVLGRRFSPSRIWDDCRAHGAVQFNTLGGMVSMLLKQAARDDDGDNPVRTVLSAGCPADRWEELQSRFDLRIVEWYGMVDAPGYLLNDSGRIGSMGKPVGTTEFRLVDTNDEPVPAGSIGEIVFRNPGERSSEYHNLPDATDDAYRGGWFHSGDLASTDDDGFYYYRGRKKESMRRRGENISAWEVESVLNLHPAVLESAAHAVPSDLGEDEVKAAVVLRPGMSVDPVELLDFCRGRMAYYAVPRYIEFLEQLPKTGTHRVQYRTLKERGITDTTWDREAAGYRLQRA